MGDRRPSFPRKNRRHSRRLEILQDEEMLQALRESEEDAKAGRLSTLGEVRRELGLA